MSKVKGSELCPGAMALESGREAALGPWDDSAQGDKKHLEARDASPVKG